LRADDPNFPNGQFSHRGPSDHDRVGVHPASL
jgi:hypothetical protein